MTTTPNLQITLLEQSQGQKEVTINEALVKLDAMFGGGVLDRDVTDPSTLTPFEGDRYIVATSAIGDWSGHDGEIAYFLSGAWRFLLPAAGVRLWVVDEAVTLVFSGGLWVAEPDSVTGANGSFTVPRVIEEELELSGAFVESNEAFPDRAIVLGVSCRTTEAITGATSYDCGINGEQDKFGSLLSIFSGSINKGVIGPTAVYAATPVRLTANGSDFTGGKVRIALHFWEIGAPIS